MKIFVIAFFALELKTADDDDDDDGGRDELDDVAAESVCGQI